MAPDTVRISPDVLESIVAHAKAARPQECCGLLIGVDGVIVEAVASANVAADPARRYEIAPTDYVTQIRRCRARTSAEGRAYAVVGAYHSHPHSSPEPSPTDVEQAFSEFVYVIAGPADAEIVHTRAYRLGDDGMQPVTIAVS